ncbi:MAG: DNA gyrase subunit B [Mycoplasmataceae bacterium]|nr:DNA gyrase subunit B [Mycoplasmataceae bacterium]
MSKEYDASSIQIIENLEAVRKRPGMYIGSVSSKGMHHLIWEILDNAVDEYLAGYCKNISVILNKDGSITISDDGRGLPVDIHPKTKVSAAETIFTVLHAGGKFGGSDSAYKVSGGLHGVGASVTNALSEFLYVDIYKDNIHYKLKFNNGGSKIEHLEKQGSTRKKGTTISFKPDSSFFSKWRFDEEIILDRLRETSYLNSGLKISYLNMSTDTEEEFFSEVGLVDFINYLDEGKSIIIENKSFNANVDEFQLMFAFHYNKSSNEKILSFANNIKTILGGSHETAFKSAFTKAFNDYLKSQNLFKSKEKKFEGSEIREGLTAVVSVNVPEQYLQFEGQTKEKLSSPDVRRVLESHISKELGFWFIENKKDSELILHRARKVREAKIAAQKAKELVKKSLTKKDKMRHISSKLTVATSKKRKECELFLVEGDSAGGSAKLGRNRNIQAVLPLRGKVINTEKANINQILANEELSTIIHAIGSGLGDTFDYEKSNYGKVIIMTDADTDGAHIQSLILTFFFNYMYELIEKGCVYLAAPPLFKITSANNKKNFSYAWNEIELDEIKREMGEKFEIQRYKGLGEMNYDQLWETTMNPDTRTLIKVTSDNYSDIQKIITVLMGNDPSIRREWINDNVTFEEENNG